MGWLRYWVIWVRLARAAAMAKANTSRGFSSFVLSEMVELKYIWRCEGENLIHYVRICHWNLELLSPWWHWNNCFSELRQGLQLTLWVDTVLKCFCVLMLHQFFIQASKLVSPRALPNIKLLTLTCSANKQLAAVSMPLSISLFLSPPLSLATIKTQWLH